MPQRANHGAPGHRAELASQKKSLHASEQDTERVQQARAASRAETASRDPECFTYSAAAGVNLAMPHRSGRAPQGEGGVGAVPQNDGALLGDAHDRPAHRHVPDPGGS
jgi:hypothetical protein